MRGDFVPGARRSFGQKSTKAGEQSWNEHPIKHTDDTVVRGALGILTGLRGTAERGTGDIRIRNGRIAEIGEIAAGAGETTIDARNCVIYPGLVSTHQHLFQSVLKGITAGIGLPLEGWVREVLFRYWHRFDERALEIAATVGIAELLLSGATTVTDHHFLYAEDDAHDGADVIFAVAERLGVRLVFCRGGATLEAQGANGPGMRSTPWESLETMLRRVGELAARYNDPGPAALRRVVFAPSTPLWSVRPHELRAIADAARDMGIMLHTHLSETSASVAYCHERHGIAPVNFLHAHGWLGRDVWLAHLTHLDAAELELLAQTGTGMAHCAQSNCRLGAGVAPAVRFAELGGRVSLGVDGAASNESAGMLDELQGAFHIHRAHLGPGALRAEEVVRWATAGGADVLGLPDIGTIAVGQVADLAIFALDHPRYAGLHDPLIGPALGGGAGHVRALLAAGRPIVRDGAIPGLDLARLCADATDIVRQLQAEHGQ